MTATTSTSLVLPENVKNIIQALIDHGYEAYAVGGCVRDSLINREPGDWDITTSAFPFQVKEIFRRTIDTGIVHGTVTVMIGKEGYEVTTYRIDGDYEDGRHPKSVEFTSSLVEDLKRRDFTINAMAYNDVCGIVDEFDGIGDLNRGIIRCVGRAMDRFTEDALRILRAIRFSAQLGYQIEDETRAAISALAHNLDKISKERIHTELNKMLKSEHPDYFLMADELGIMQVIIPEFAACTEDEKAFAGCMAKLCPVSLSERYAAMLIGLQDSKTVAKILRGLKLDNDTINMAEALTKFYNFEVTTDERALRHMMHTIGTDKLDRVYGFRIAYEEAKALMAIEGADSAANSDANDVVDAGYTANSAEAVRESYEVCKRIIDRGDCLSLKQLAVTGQDLMDAGVPAGRSMGMVLGELLNRVLDRPELNTKETLLPMVQGILGIL